MPGCLSYRCRYCLIMHGVLRRLYPFDLAALRYKRRVTFQSTYPRFLRITDLFLLRVERIYKVYPEEAYLEVVPFGVSVLDSEIYVRKIDGHFLPCFVVAVDRKLFKVVQVDQKLLFEFFQVVRRQDPESFEIFNFPYVGFL